MNHLSRTLFASFAALSVLFATYGANAKSTLRAALQGEVKILDPIATQAYITRTFAYLVFDVLIAQDSTGNYHPQMLQSYKASKDKMSYTFTLRDGLKWSDGTDVTSADCVASLKRWGSRDSMGKDLFAHTKSLEAVDEKTFRLELSKPYGWVIDSIGKPGNNVPVMMPERLASTPATEAIKEVVGSGPWVFKQDEWVPGSLMAFEKNKYYMPRDEAPDGFAGGKVAKVDRIELVVIPDPATKIAALQAGEIDYVQSVSFDFLPMIEADKGLKILPVNALQSFMGGAILNVTQPPFDNPGVRKALHALVNQQDILDALGAPAGYGQVCYSLFMCGAVYSTDAAASQAEPNIERAAKLLKEAGYKGEKVVVLHATSSDSIHLIATVLEEQMRRAGFNVEVEAMDWTSIAQRRFSKDTPDKGGWSMYPARFSAFDQISPFTNYATGYNCNPKSFTGWNCNAAITPLVDAFVQSDDMAERKALVNKMQAELGDTSNFVMGGQFATPDIYRSELSGVLSVGLPVFWNISK